MTFLVHDISYCYFIMFLNFDQNKSLCFRTSNEAITFKLHTVIM